MRGLHVWLLLIMLDVFVILSPLSIKYQAFASGTGIGIRKEGPERAMMGVLVVYSITVYNLGDYWIRNITVTDTFPNGTSESWNVPDLEPADPRSGGDYFVIWIVYIIQPIDVIRANSYCITNHAEVTGYSDARDQGLLAHAETNYPTLVVPSTVGGHSVAMKIAAPLMPDTVYITVLLITTAAFSALRAKAGSSIRNRRRPLIKRKA
jgi:uncharacterized repeat protein (TIGR01451 family)